MSVTSPLILLAKAIKYYASKLMHKIQTVHLLTNGGMPLEWNSTQQDSVKAGESVKQTPDVNCSSGKFGIQLMH